MLLATEMRDGGRARPLPGEVWQRGGVYYAVVARSGFHGRIRLSSGALGVDFEAEERQFFADPTLQARRLFHCDPQQMARLWVVVLQAFRPTVRRFHACPELNRALERVRAAGGFERQQLELPFEEGVPAWLKARW